MPPLPPNQEKTVKRLLRDLTTIVLLATLWIAGGWLTGRALQIFLGLETSGAPFPIVCSALNAIIGLTALTIVTRNPKARQALYDGTGGSLPVGWLWAVTFSVPLYGLIFLGVMLLTRWWFSK
jgi:hypothetical protein